MVTVVSQLTHIPNRMVADMSLILIMASPLEYFLIRDTIDLCYLLWLQKGQPCLTCSLTHVLLE